MAMAQTPALPDPVFWRGRRVLLTGHTGFKGAWLSLWLHRLGAQVTGFSLPAISPGLHEVVREKTFAAETFGDIRDARAINDAMHTARPDFDLAAASAYNSEMVKQKQKIMKALGMRTTLEDMLITLGDQIHVIKLVGGGGQRVGPIQRHRQKRARQFAQAGQSPQPQLRHSARRSLF